MKKYFINLLRALFGAYLPKTQYEMVQELHKNAGHPVRLYPTIPHKKETDLMVGLIEEELKELKEAIANKDLKEVVDALGDLNVVINGACVRCGVDADSLAMLIHESNMSKFCDTEEEARLGATDYIQKGVPATYEQNELGNWVIYRDSDRKFLKGPGFFEPKINEWIFDPLEHGRNYDY